jgi:hypothetical protein
VLHQEIAINTKTDDLSPAAPVKKRKEPLATAARDVTKIAAKDKGKKKLRTETKEDLKKRARKKKRKMARRAAHRLAGIANEAVPGSSQNNSILLE